MAQLSHAAETLLLIMCANGGDMNKDDANAELKRVLSLSPEAYAEWRQRIVPLVKMHAERVLKLNDNDNSTR